MSRNDMSICGWAYWGGRLRWEVVVEDRNPKSKSKPSHWGSVSVNEMRGMLEFRRWDENGARYVVVEGLGGGE